MTARAKVPTRTPIAESVIRDRLAERLELIEDGLTLVKVEQHLPSMTGASGFVDIVAQDQLGKLVLIEIKRSSAASREAIQELLKYLALFVEDHGLRRGQLRCLVVSTSWHELSAPFSEVAASGAFQFEGFILEVGPDGSPLKVTPFEREASEALKLAQPYMLVCYESEEHRDAAGAAVIDFFASRPAISGLLIYQHYEGGDPAVVYPFAVTLCLASMTASEIASYITEDDEYASEVTSEWSLLSMALRAAPEFPRELLSRGAFQFVAAVNRGWRPSRHVRVGPWATSPHWNDDELFALACGFGSKNGMYLQFVARPKDQVDWKFRIAQIAELFEPDTRLKKIALASLDDFATRHPAGVMGFSAFYPEDLLLAVCSPVLAPGDRFSPRLEILMLPSSTSTERARIVRFALCWDLKTYPFSAAASLIEIYGGVEPYHVLSVLHDHFSYRGRLLKKLGFRWRAFEATSDGDNCRELTLAKGRMARRVIAPRSIPLVHAFIEANWNWVCDVVGLLAAYQVEIVTPISPDTYFQERPHKCDLCERAFTTRVYDALVPPRGFGAFMCRECFHYHGSSAWSPYWDEFTKLSDGKWYLTRKYSQDD